MFCLGKEQSVLHQVSTINFQTNRLQEKMTTTLDDKLLGFKSQNYASSSESEGEDNEEKTSDLENNRNDAIDTGDIPAPPDFRLEVPKVTRFVAR